MTPQKALEQLRRCAHGYCDTCVHQDENCHDRIEKNVRTVGAGLLQAESQKQLQDGTFMNKPEEE